MSLQVIFHLKNAYPVTLIALYDPNSNKLVLTGIRVAETPKPKSKAHTFVAAWLQQAYREGFRLKLAENIRPHFSDDPRSLENSLLMPTTSVQRAQATWPELAPVFLATELTAGYLDGFKVGGIIRLSLGEGSWQLEDRIKELVINTPRHSDNPASP